jgi:cytochrome c-type biogenesis protein CcmE
MKARNRMILGVVALAVFGGLAFLNFNRTLARYVSFSEARAATGAVQVAGFPDHQKATFHPGTGEFAFTMEDEGGDVMPVVYRGVKPGNFDQAEKVVVVGKIEGDVLQASQILVKCPSKYDDLSTDEYRDEYEAQHGESGDEMAPASETDAAPAQNEAPASGTARDN